jgi:hypothetical protein
VIEQGYNTARYDLNTVLLLFTVVESRRCCSYLELLGIFCPSPDRQDLEVASSGSWMCGYRCFGDDGKEGGCVLQYVQGGNGTTNSTLSFRMEQFGKEQAHLVARVNIFSDSNMSVNLQRL